MCGICGFIGNDIAIGEPAVRRMMRAMPHRGPDDEGYEELPFGTDDNRDSALFGFRRLAILDLSFAGHQPMFDGSSGNCLIFNGEIYNYRSLRKKLESRGIVFRSTGDTEVLLHALSEWGEHALDELDGMYAIAFYEARKRRVLLARDPVGVKPLYYAWASDQLLFASEVRAILASGLISRDFDPAGIAGYLAYGAPQDPRTVHKEIKSFPSGTYQWIGSDTLRTKRIPADGRRFWTLPQPRHARHRAEAAESLRAVLDNTVREHLVSDAPVAFFLSGGIDSAAITALAAQYTGTVDTFCLGFDSPGMKSELAVAEISARRLGARHTPIVLTQHSIADHWDRWITAADRPGVDGLNTFIISQAVKAANAKVAFSGLGADEVFGGYGTFFRVPRLLRLAKTAAVLAPPFRNRILQLLGRLIPPRYKQRAMILAETNGTPLDVCLRLKQMLDSTTLSTLGFDPTSLHLNGNFLDHDQIADCGEYTADVFRTVSCVETTFYMGSTLLRDSDTNSMAHSIELRVPFVGRRVLEEAAATPGNLHLGGGSMPKQVLRDAVANLLAPEVLNRKKTGFTIPLGDWMFDRLRDSCEAAIDGLHAIPFLDQNAARRLWDHFVQNRQHNYWMKPLLLVSLGAYADACSRTFIDDSGALKMRAPRTRSL